MFPQVTTWSGLLIKILLIRVAEELRTWVGLSIVGITAKGTKYSRSAFLGSLIHNKFYLHPIFPHSVELWLISSTLTI